MQGIRGASIVISRQQRDSVAPVLQQLAVQLLLFLVPRRLRYWLDLPAVGRRFTEIG